MNLKHEYWIKAPFKGLSLFLDEADLKSLKYARVSCFQSLSALLAARCSSKCFTPCLCAYVARRGRSELRETRTSAAPREVRGASGALVRLGSVIPCFRVEGVPAGT